MGPFGKEQNDFVPDLLGLYSIDNRVECRRDDYIKVSKHNVKGTWYIMSKAMSKNGEECWYIEHEDDTDVRTTGTKGFLAGITGREAKNST